MPKSETTLTAVEFSTDANSYTVAERIRFERHLDTDFDAALLWLPMAGIEFSGLGGMETDQGALPEGADLRIPRPVNSDGRPVRSGEIMQTLAWLTARREHKDITLDQVLELDISEVADPKDGE